MVTEQFQGPLALQGPRPRSRTNQLQIPQAFSGTTSRSRTRQISTIAQDISPRQFSLQDVGFSPALGIRNQQRLDLRSQFKLPRPAPARGRGFDPFRPTRTPGGLLGRFQAPRIGFDGPTSSRSTRNNVLGTNIAPSLTGISLFQLGGITGALPTGGQLGVLPGDVRFVPQRRTRKKKK